MPTPPPPEPPTPSPLFSFFERMLRSFLFCRLRLFARNLAPPFSIRLPCTYSVWRIYHVSSALTVCNQMCLYLLLLLLLLSSSFGISIIGNIGDVSVISVYCDLSLLYPMVVDARLCRLLSSKVVLLLLLMIDDFAVYARYHQFFFP